jgi:hypothetical protein
VDANLTEIGYAQVANPESIRNWTLAWVNVSGESVPIAVYRNFISFAPSFYVRYERINCSGASYIAKGDYDEWQFNSVNMTEFIPAPNGQAVSRVDINSLLTGVTAQSYKRVRTLTGGPAFECVNQVHPGPLYPLVYFGDLPSSTPPYSVRLITN